MNTKEILSQLSLEEKAELCAGKDFWHLVGIERLGLPSVMVTDGPHGLRKQAGSSDHLGINVSVPAICFPTASATASSFDRTLLHAIGEALGEECQQEQVSVLLGPGANIKRSPLCGRNFEYISEDPFVTGELATSLVKGVQSKGIGTSLKHFAANNQEARRMITDSVIDERALREIYLSGFETVVKKAQPWTVMCSYNRLCGEYLSQNKRMLTDILRDEWGFEGAVVTDWGACNDRVAGILAGLDLEMPGANAYNSGLIMQAVSNGSLSEKDLDLVVERVITLLQKSKEGLKQNVSYDIAQHHALARRAAAESCVLLKNQDNILPLRKKAGIAIIGAFAKAARYQGAGSSKINPIQIDNACDEFTKQGYTYEYADGYSLERKAQPEADKIEAACKLAAQNEIAIIFAGLPDEYESEGFDRSSMDMPASHIQLIEAVARVNPNVIVALQCGSPVVMPWAKNVKAILLAYLGGQGGGSACVDVLGGTVNPSGKLAETFPLSLNDTSCYDYFPGNDKSVEYRESIYVGYRYYDTAKKDVEYPFGFGLSYTQFEYTNLQLSCQNFAKDNKLSVSFTITNTGTVAGAEVAQLYVGLEKSKIYRAEKELKGFEKVFLEPQESKPVTIVLDSRSFAYYNVAIKDWAVEGGSYCISIGASSRDIRLADQVTAIGDGKELLLSELMQKAAPYFNIASKHFAIDDSTFVSILGRSLPPSCRRADEPFTQNSTLGDIQVTDIGKMFLQRVAAVLPGAIDGGEQNDLSDMASAMMMDLPLRVLGMMGGNAISMTQINEIIYALNQELASK